MAVKRAKTSRGSTAAAKAAPAKRAGTGKRAAARKGPLAKAVKKSAPRKAAKVQKATPQATRGKVVKPKVAKPKVTKVAKAKVAKAKGQVVKANAVNDKPAANHDLAPAPPASLAAVVKVVQGALDEMKALNVQVLNVHELTDITDTMVIASGNSDRHVRSIAERVVEHAKKAGFRPTGVEGERDGEWVLVDLQDVIVHIMLPRVREFYRLENLWDVSAARRELAERSA